MKKIIAIIIISIWAIMGVIGVLRCKENRVNIEMLFFLFSAPFLVFIKYLL
jgi:hypothetical protein